MQHQVGAILTGGDFQALGAIRTLARKGIPIVVLDSDFCISKYSRFVKKIFKAPRLSDESSYVNFLIKLAGREGVKGWVIYPNSDEAVYILSKNKKVLQDYYRIPTPSWDVIKNVYIKKNTYQVAEQNGIPVPKTYYPTSLKELKELDITFPLVIKLSIREAENF